MNEVPRTLVEYSGGGGRPVPQVDLYAERSYVRETAKRNLYTGKTYNSVENISSFFSERGMPLTIGVAASGGSGRPKPPASQALQKPVARPPQSAASPKKRAFGAGSTGAASEIWPRNRASP